MADEFPGSDSRIVRDLERRIEALEAQVRQVRGVPVTRTSGPLYIPNGSPSTPSGGFVLYSSGGEGRWVSSSGVDKPLTPAVPKAAWVSDPNPMGAGSAPGSYNQTYVQNLRNDTDQVRTKWVALRDSLIAAGLMFPS